MKRRALLVGLIAVLLGSPAPAEALFEGTLTPSRCIANKVNCIAKLKSCLVTCHQKALRLGIAVDAACLEKCRNKFDQNPAIPGKGCFAKLEAKGGCGASVGDAATFAAKVEAQVREAMAQLIPVGGTPQNTCAAGKTNCLRKYGSCILSLVRKAASAGTAIGDTSRCTRYLDLEHGSCVAKLEARYCHPLSSGSCTSTAPPCLSFSDAISLRHQDDAFTDDAIFALETGPPAPNTQRCTGDTSVQCTSAPGGIAGCGGALGTCEFFVSAPVPFGPLCFFSCGGLCLTQQWNGTISGTFDQATGASSGVGSLISRAYLSGTVGAPCPRCELDPFPNDGVSAGTCSGGSRNGLACDGNGQSPEPSFGVTSLDCPPTNEFGTFTLDLTNSTASSTRALTTSSPNCTDAPGKKCLCASCSLDSTIACSDHAECAVAGAGMCNNGAGEPQKPSACVDDSTQPGDGSLCVETAPGEGWCAEGPITQHCLIESFRDCSQSTQAYDCPLPGDSCGRVGRRSCFPDYNGNVGDTISAEGHPGDPRNGAAPIAFGAVFCVAPTSSPLINITAGLPGPGRLELAGVGEDDGGPTCPTRASFLPTSKDAVLDIGWTGHLHDRRAVGQSRVTVATTCTGTYPQCSCSYTGPVPN
jgi:hypothetical protein